MMKYTKWSKMPIGGVWRDGSSVKTAENNNPYNGELLTSLQLASAEDVDEAYRVAQQVQTEWFQKPPEQRVRVMETAASLLEEQQEEAVRLLIEETGATYIKAVSEVQAAIALIKESSTYPMKMEEEAAPSVVPGKENRIYREPAGVINVITSWNYPLSLSMRSVAPALATGNGVVIKPASHTPITGGTFIAHVFEQAGAPEGLISVLVGSGSEIGDKVVEHPIPRVISFTGSTEVGKRIGALAGQHVKEVSLELGGNNAFIVLDDADVEQAAAAAVFGKFMHQGQICMAINRMIVTKDVYEPFVQALKDKVLQLKAGDPKEKDTTIGPLIDQKQVQEMQELVHQGTSEGATLYLEGKTEGNVVFPTIFTDVDNDMSIAQEEIFGPVALVIAVENEEEAIQAANDTNYGLTASVFSRSSERSLRVAKQLHTGMVHINDQTVNSEPAMPFGGEKDSGLGRFGGKWILEKFTTVKWVSVQKEKRSYPIFQ
ncbi:aldehyde dehydrogenase (NAD+) [Alteribacillus persepolensis]|uniref:3-sulfolactaldehyde dehydrogenase n=1 Tax=Alteribacillus persepolensis TaxID=568899 RepID=A0A1G8AU30_9BACI|nr:aldehyde dehydrogenase family protein [Alteribacillus persepolensis]SDH24344.1 aldehyde dehydrogenase (NAD+) [Alteribacillus persepolensis]